MTDAVPADNIRLKRAYDKPSAEDGGRILVDRLWPRGISKDAAALEYWAKDLAPSTELRKWFHHEPRLWEEFRWRYVEELRENRQQLTQLRDRARAGRITLIYASRDERQNDAVVLRDILLGR
jgi:uncharacterized protein YeaO (DUF488 family)